MVKSWIAPGLEPSRGGAVALPREPCHIQRNMMPLENVASPAARRQARRALRLLRLLRLLRSVDCTMDGI